MCVNSFFVNFNLNQSLPLMLFNLVVIFDMMFGLFNIRQFQASFSE